MIDVNNVGNFDTKMLRNFEIWSWKCRQNARQKFLHKLWNLPPAVRTYWWSPSALNRSRVSNMLRLASGSQSPMLARWWEGLSVLSKSQKIALWAIAIVARSSVIIICSPTLIIVPRFSLFSNKKTFIRD